MNWWCLLCSKFQWVALQSPRHYQPFSHYLNLSLDHCLFVCWGHLQLLHPPGWTGRLRPQTSYVSWSPFGCRMRHLGSAWQGVRWANAPKGLLRPWWDGASPEDDYHMFRWDSAIPEGDCMLSRSSDDVPEPRSISCRSSPLGRLFYYFVTNTLAYRSLRLMMLYDRWCFLHQGSSNIDINGKNILLHFVAACILSGMRTMQGAWMGWFACIGLFCKVGAIRVIGVGCVIFFI